MFDGKTALLTESSLNVCFPREKITHNKVSRHCLALTPFGAAVSNTSHCPCLFVCAFNNRLGLWQFLHIGVKTVPVAGLASN